MATAKVGPPHPPSASPNRQAGKDMEQAHEENKPPVPLPSVRTDLEHGPGAQKLGVSAEDQHDGWIGWLLLLPIIRPTLKNFLQPYLGDMLPDSLIQKRVAAFGFVLFGITSVLPNNQTLIKEFSTGGQVAVLMFIGFVWILPSVGVPCTLFGRTRIEHLLSQHTARLGLLGITLLVILQIGLMLPNNFWSTSGGHLNKRSVGGFIGLMILAIIGHICSWLVSWVSGEEIEVYDDHHDKTSPLSFVGPGVVSGRKEQQSPTIEGVGGKR